MSIKLLPCPCCGTSSIYTGTDIANELYESVRCYNCGLKMVKQLPLYFPEGVNDIDSLRELYKNEAIEAWNKRVV